MWSLGNAKFPGSTQNGEQIGQSNWPLATLLDSYKCLQKPDKSTCAPGPEVFLQTEIPATPLIYSKGDTVPSLSELHMLDPDLLIILYYAKRQFK